MDFGTIVPKLLMDFGTRKKHIGFWAIFIPKITNRFWDALTKSFFLQKEQQEEDRLRARQRGKDNK